MPLNFEHFAKCIATLETSLARLQAAKPESADYEVFRHAVIKGFELTLELAGRLLRKVLKDYGGAPREIDALLYKDVFKKAAKHGILNTAQVERWFSYRDNRNRTAHDYGVKFAEKTLALMPGFLLDARDLEKRLQSAAGGNPA